MGSVITTTTARSSNGQNGLKLVVPLSDFPAVVGEISRTVQFYG